MMRKYGFLGAAIFIVIVALVVLVLLQEKRYPTEYNGVPSLSLNERTGKIALSWIYDDGFYEKLSRYRFDEIGFFNEGLAAIRIGPRWGVIDRSGTITVEPTFAYIGIFSGGIAPFRDPSSQLMGYIDKNGNVVIDARFAFCDLHVDDLARVQTEDSMNGYGYIDRCGDFVIHPIFSWAENFSEGFAHVRTTDDKDIFINRLGNQVSIPIAGALLRDFHDGFALFVQDNKYGAMNTNGVIIAKGRDYIVSVKGARGVFARIADAWSFVSEDGVETAVDEVEDVFASCMDTQGHLYGARDPLYVTVHGNKVEAVAWLVRMGILSSGGIGVSPKE